MSDDVTSMDLVRQRLRLRSKGQKRRGPKPLVQPRPPKARAPPPPPPPSPPPAPAPAVAPPALSLSKMMRMEREQEGMGTAPCPPPSVQRKAPVPPPPIGNDKAERALRAFLRGFPPDRPKRGLPKHAVTLWGPTGCGKSRLARRALALEGFDIVASTDAVLSELQTGRSLAASLDAFCRPKLGGKRGTGKKKAILLDDFAYVVDAAVLTALTRYLGSNDFVARGVAMVIVVDNRFDSRFKSLIRHCADARMFAPYASAIRAALAPRLGSYRASRIAEACGGDLRQATMMAKYGEALGQRDARQSTFELCAAAMRSESFSDFGSADDLLHPMLRENFVEEYGSECVSLPDGSKSAESVEVLDAVADAFSLDDVLGYGNKAEQITRTVHAFTHKRPFFGADRKLSFPSAAAFGNVSNDATRMRKILRKLRLPLSPLEASVAMRLVLEPIKKNRHAMVEFKRRYDLDDDDVKFMHALTKR